MILSSKGFCNYKPTPCILSVLEVLKQQAKAGVQLRQSRRLTCRRPWGYCRGSAEGGVSDTGSLAFLDVCVCVLLPILPLFQGSKLRRSKGPETKGSPTAKCQNRNR